jgi:hypothetical protein
MRGFASQGKPRAADFTGVAAAGGCVIWRMFRVARGRGLP